MAVEGAAVAAVVAGVVETPRNDVVVNGGVGSGVGAAGAVEPTIDVLDPMVQQTILDRHNKANAQQQQPLPMPEQPPVALMGVNASHGQEGQGAAVADGNIPGQPDQQAPGPVRQMTDRTVQRPLNCIWPC